MTRPAPRHSHGRGRNCGLSEYRRGLSFQSFSVEALEDRILLAGDIVAWQNPLIPADVNGDGFVAPNDLLFVANALLRNGSRSPGEISGDAAGEEDGSSHYLDVNGDGFLSSEDAHIIAMGMDGAHTTQVVQLRLELTDISDNPIETTNVNDEVLLHVLVQDMRPNETLNRGVTAAFLDVAFDASFASVSGGVTFGDEYKLLPECPDCASPGRYLDLGNSVSDFGLGGPLGPGEFLLAKIPFNIDAAPVTVVDDDATTDTALNVSEDGPATIVDVTANDMMGGVTVWRGEPATTLVFSDSYLWDDPTTPVPTHDIIYGTDSITINGVGALQITALDTVGTTGNVTNHGNGTMTYDPNGQFDHLKQGESTTDTFGYTAASGSATDTATVVVTIMGENDSPMAADDMGGGFMTTADMPVITPNVLGNDTDPEDDTLAIVSMDTAATVGQVTNHTDGTFTYDPNGQFDDLNAGETATDSFRYTITDGNGRNSTATVTIRVESVGGNLPPDVMDDSGIGFITDQDSAFTTASVLLNDSDPEDDPLSVISMDDSGTLGLVSNNGDGTFDYDPNGQFDYLGPGEQAFDIFNYTATDGDPSVTHESTTSVTVTIDGVNDPPNASPDSGAGFVTDEDTPFLTSSVLLNDSDPENDGLTVVGCDGGMGTMTCNLDGTIDYVPTGNFDFLANGETTTDTFNYFVFDGTDTRSASVEVVIEGKNDLPVANLDSGFYFTTAKNTSFTTANVLANDEDVDGDPLTVLSLDTTGTLGIVTNNGDGTFDYDPNGQFDNLPMGSTATDTFAYAVSDGHGGTDMATVTIDIVGERQVVFRLETSDLDGVPISEVVQSDSFLLNVYVQDVRQDKGPEDRGVFQAYLDVTHDPAFGIATGPFIHGANFLEETSGSLSVGLIDEAGGTQTGFGLDPVISGPLGPAEILLFSVVMEATAPGTLAFSSDPADVADIHDVALFAPPVSVHPDNITYHQMSILVTPAPVVADPDGGAGFTTDEDTPFTTGNVLDNDTDREGGTLFVSSFDASSTIGIVTSNGDGTFDYDPNGQFEYLQPGESTTDMFAYTATDGDPDHNMNSAMVTITILGVNDSPVAMDDGGVGFTTDENLAFTTQSVFSNDSDIEGDDIILLGCSSTVGQASCNPDGTIDYDPNGQFGNVLVGESVTDRIDYSITDGNGGFAEATAFITIEGSPPLPGTIGGFVFADVDHDGDKDVVERAIGGAEVRLVGEDALGNAVSRTAYTNSLGRFDFFNVIAGDYELIEVQPMFFVDGIDSVDGVIHTGVNDRISIETTHVNMPAFEVLFGERSLHPDFISIEDFVNTELRQGIVVGFDVAGNQVWNSVMDGWEGITGVVADFSADGNTAFLTVTRDTGETFNYAVPTDRTAGYFRVKGETAAGRVVQFIGTMSDLTPLRTTSLVDAAFASI